MSSPAKSAACINKTLSIFRLVAQEDKGPKEKAQALLYKEKVRHLQLEKCPDPGDSRTTLKPRPNYL